MRYSLEEIVSYGVQGSSEHDSILSQIESVFIYQFLEFKHFNCSQDPTKP